MIKIRECCFFLLFWCSHEKNHLKTRICAHLLIEKLNYIRSIWCIQYLNMIAVYWVDIILSRTNYLDRYLVANSIINWLWISKYFKWIEKKEAYVRTIKITEAPFSTWMSYFFFFRSWLELVDVRDRKNSLFDWQKQIKCVYTVCLRMCVYLCVYD